MPIPAAITSSPAIWVDALQDTTADGSTVSQMTDRGPNLYHGLQGATAQRAIMRTSGINGKPAYEFDGGDDMYTFTAAGAKSLFQNVGGGTIAVVVRDPDPTSVPASGGGDRIWFWSNGVQNNVTRFAVNHDATNAQVNITARRADTDSAITVTATPLSADPSFYIGIADWANGNLYLYRNGVKFEAIGVLTPGVTDNTTSVGVSIGAQTSTTNKYKGFIGLAAAWPRVLSAAEILELSRYVQDNWLIAQSNYLTPPTGLTATTVSASRIDLSWTASTGATGYDVERNGVVIATDVVGTTYSDTGLNAATAYTYRVRSVR